MDTQEGEFSPPDNKAPNPERRQLFRSALQPIIQTVKGTTPLRSQAIPIKTWQKEQARTPRRNVLKGLGSLAVAVGVGKAWDLLLHRPTAAKPTEQNPPSATPKPKEAIVQAQPLQEVKNVSLVQINQPLEPMHKKEIGEKQELPKVDLHKPANEVLKLKPNTPQREQMETSFTQTVLKLKEYEPITKALKVVVGWENRAKLLLEQYQLRQEGEIKLKPLSPNKIKWAEKQEMHPETLAICLDAYPKAFKLIEWAFNKDRKKFRPDLVHLINQKRLALDIDKLSADDIMINPGGLAMLLRTEAGWAVKHLSSLTKEYMITSLGLVNIGTKPALDNVTSKEQEADREALTRIIQNIKQEGFEYQADNIVGSEGGEDDVSGGAIAMQMRIQRVLTIMETIMEYNKQAPEELKIDPNPFTPESSAIYVWFFLAQGFEFSTEEGIKQRYGYLKGYENVIKASLEAWNQDPNQVKKIYNAAKNYWENFSPAKTLTQH